MFSNNQHETPKKIHIAVLRIGSKTPLLNTHVCSHTQVDIHEAHEAADDSLILKLLSGSLTLVSRLNLRTVSGGLSFVYIPI